MCCTLQQRKYVLLKPRIRSRGQYLQEQRTILTGVEDNTYRSRGQYLQEQRTILTGAEDNTYRSRGQYLQE
jgi:hypothetical protein